MSNEELISLAKAGDTQAERRLFEENEAFVRYIAKKFANSGIDHEELASVARLGMLKAYQSFDADKGYKFATFASFCMENEILMFLRKQRKHLSNVSIDAVLATDSNGHEMTLSDTISGGANVEDEVLASSLKEQLIAFGNTLSGRDRILWTRIFIDRATQAELAEELSISQSYISRLQKSLLDRFRKFTGLKEAIQLSKSERTRTMRQTTQPTGLTSRSATPEEAAKYGINPAVLPDAIEWFLDVNVPTIPTISLTKLGVMISEPAVEEINMEITDHINIGFHAAQKRLMLRKAEGGRGLPIKKPKDRNGLMVHNQRLSKWLQAKQIKLKRYPLQWDEKAGAYYIDVEIGQAT